MILNSKNILFVIAHKDESEGMFEKHDINVIFTGVGKVNATYSLAKKINEMRLSENLPKYVVNLGSCGSKKFKKGELVYCNKFYQRDMDVTIFGYEKGVTPSDHFGKIIEHKKLLDNLPMAQCSSGDNFVTTEDKSDKSDVFEMEAYALARVCSEEKIDFIAIKYITDGLNEEGGDDWKKEVKGASETLYEYFLNNFQNKKSS